MLRSSGLDRSDGVNEPLGVLPEIYMCFYCPVQLFYFSKIGVSGQKEQWNYRPGQFNKNSLFFPVMVK